jgi:FtsP/CotA-like multicopper oxidase with cupredoxin domain
MSKKNSRKALNRRDFLKIGGGLLGAAASSTLLPKVFLRPDKVVEAARVEANEGKVVQHAAAAPALAAVSGKELHFVATDGWIYIDPAATVPPYHPDNMAPDPFTTYIFGFRDVTTVTNKSTLVYAQKMKSQLTAPLFWLDQETDNLLKITNLGLAVRPDLIDAHTLHFHGFRNAIPIFDGEPHSSVGVPIARDLTYFYRPHDPGTYMYHCHFEETEHVHMGMIGPCFVTPIQNKGGEVDANGANIPAGKYVYNDGLQPGDPGSTAYDREFIMLVSEIWTESHWCDSHVQLPEWSDYNPEFYLLNGRAYPDTLLPNGGGTDKKTGDLIPPTGHPELQYQPMSSLVRCNAGDRVLFRIINLGFEQQAMQLAGIKMRVVGKDATLLRGRNGADLTYLTNTVAVGPGESTDAIFTAPPHQGPGSYDTYLFYSRNFHRLNNGGHGGYGGAMTEIHVYPSGVAAQTAPNT